MNSNSGYYLWKFEVWLFIATRKQAFCECKICQNIYMCTYWFAKMVRQALSYSHILTEKKLKWLRKCLIYTPWRSAFFCIFVGVSEFFYGEITCILLLTFCQWNLEVKVASLILKLTIYSIFSIRYILYYNTVDITLDH